MNGYELSRKWFDWCFENPEKINSNHSALYFFCIEHCNRLGWKKKFGLPTGMAKEALGIKSYNTYIKTLTDLIEFGFIELIEKSKNQYSSNIIALSNFNKATTKALDKALIKHSTKQRESTIQSTDSIDKQGTINNKPLNNKQIIPDYFDFESYVISQMESDDFEKIKVALKLKYESWKENDWKDGNDKKIKNWKSKILNSIPYLQKENGKSNYEGVPAHRRPAFS